MRGNAYGPEIRSALADLTALALERERSARLDGVSKAIGRWKRGRIGSDEALEEVRRTAGGPEVSWHRDADPGVPVAHAVAMGLLSRSDIPDRVWESIEILVTLAGI